MDDLKIREKYDLNGKRHGIILFIQMILVILGMAICVLELISGSPNYVVSIDMLLIFMLIVGYAVYGYKFPIISVQVALVLIAVIDVIALFISSHQGLEVGSFILVIIINCLLIAAAITMKKSFKISQSLLYICFVIDFVQIIIKNIHAPNEPLIYYFMSLQFVIMEATLLLINYSYHQRELNRKNKN